MTPDEFIALKDAGEDDGIERKREILLDTSKQKKEFILDLLSLANSHVPGKKHILIGVEDDGSLYDIADHHYDDSRFQQLVEGLIEHPIRFKYCQLQVKSVTVGCIVIEKSDKRFHVVKKDFRWQEQSGIEKILERGDTRIKRGSYKLRPTAYDYDLLRQSALDSDRKNPNIHVVFDDGDTSKTYISKRPRVLSSNRTSLGTSVEYVKPYVYVVNEGNGKAENVSLIVNDPNPLPLYRYKSEPEWEVSRDEYSSSFRYSTPIIAPGDRVLLRLPEMNTQLDSPDTIDFVYRWTAYSANAQDATSGVLNVHLIIEYAAEYAPPIRNW